MLNDLHQVSKLISRINYTRAKSGGKDIADTDRTGRETNTALSIIVLMEF